jgi:hypothetical protein
MTFDNNNNNYFYYYLYWVGFKLFEIVLFLFPAFPPEFYYRILVLLIYVIGHILGVQTMYKEYKHTTLDYYNSDCTGNQKVPDNDIL